MFKLFMASIILYGIPNCDATKKAIAWLKENNINFIFHDYKQLGISKEKIIEWDAKAGWKNFFNKRSTTWREVSKTEQDKVSNLSFAIKIIVENNSIVKRPIIEYGNKLIVGFNENDYKRAFL
jgi:arsenate reductase (glutaredoxin)